MRRDLPTGTVTFLFTDVEGSTRLLHELGAEGYAAALAEHRRVVRSAFAAEDGVEVDTQGDAFFVAFPTAPGAVRAAAQMLEGLAAGPIRVRMGIHTGTPFVAEEGYVGVDVNRAARIAAVGHGGQVLVSAAAAALLGTDGLRDLGEHRLKDLSAPERIYQLGEADFPPLTSLHRTNLPVPATPFLGREQELAEVLELLAREDVRLLTLTGPGGTGKTRLALHAAGEAAERFPHGVFWVPLAPLRDPALVLETAAAELGASDGLAAHVADKAMLLLLDNFEHVVEAAPGVAQLLTACPNLRVAVTSREVLRVPGEQVYPVAPLEPEDGAELFVARARAVRPDFTPTAVVDELCARLDNLPLAIELAAARARVLSPAQLLERLAGKLDVLKGGRGADPRQETLRATIEWSHELLGEEERRLFARLAVFAGGCTLEAAEGICDADLDTLESLVDKSLVRVRDEGRFWMLETIREFAGERLEESGDVEELRRRHAEWFLAFGEEADPHVGEYRSDWIERLDDEHDNLRAALDHLASTGETQLTMRLSGALAEFWGIRGHLAEGLRRLEAAVAADARPTTARAKALYGAADLAYGAGDAALSRRRADESLALSRSLGDSWTTATALAVLGSLDADDGDMARARDVWEESGRLYEEAGDRHNVLLTNRMLAWTHAELGDLARARSLYEDVLREARAAGNVHLHAHSLEGLATLAREEGRLDEAASLLEEAYRLHVGLGDRYRIPMSVGRFAGVLASAGDATAAAMLLAAFESLLDEVGARAPGWLADVVEETDEFVRTKLDDDAVAEARERGRGLSADEAVALALRALS